MALRNWIGLFLMGAINNLPYVIVNSAASTIADSFGKKNLVGVIFGANVSLSIFVKVLNTFALLRVPYSIRYIVNGCVMLAGLFGVAYAFDFGFAIGCIAIIGSTAAFGENVTLGFLSWFPSSLVNAWSSGTGMAGLFGSTLYIIFGCSVGHGTDKTDKLHTLTKYAFLLTTPVVVIYWLAYFIIVKRPDADDVTVQNVQSSKDLRDVMDDDDGTEEAEQTNEAPVSAKVEYEYGIAPVLQGAESSSETEPLVPKEHECRRILRCLRLVIWLSFNLCVVYIFEYVARACAAKVRPSNEYNIGCPELYAALQLCYQAGVFVSRSSVQMFKIKKVEILSFLQLLNMILWIVDVHYKFLPTAALPALMIFVGLLGGASYVNIFYTLLHDPKYPKEDRELCVNITGVFINLGIVIGTGVETLLFITILKGD